MTLARIDSILKKIADVAGFSENETQEMISKFYKKVSSNVIRAVATISEKEAETLKDVLFSLGQEKSKNSVKNQIVVLRRDSKIDKAMSEAVDEVFGQIINVVEQSASEEQKIKIAESLR